MSLCSSSYIKLQRWKITKPKTKCILTLNVNERKWQQPHLNFQVLFQTWTELTHCHWCPLPSLSWKMMLQSNQFKIVWIVNSLFPVFHITAWWHFPLSQFVSDVCIHPVCFIIYVTTKLSIIFKSALPVCFFVFFSFWVKFSKCALYPEMPCNTELQ